jgi:UDP-N-acetylglucosamine 1-carboxyvinyltransferase
MSDGSRIVASRSGPLAGDIVVPGAKNSVLKLMAATVLAGGTYDIFNVPRITDVTTMADLLRAIGLTVEFRDEPDPAPGRSGWRLRIVNPGVVSTEVPLMLADRIRASVNLVGPLLARFGEVRIAPPGGDDFGGRPIDMHLTALEAMGAVFDVRGGVIEGRAERLSGAEVEFGFPSVGATENSVMAAVVGDGETVIRNAAREPEIVDLCDMLRSMGARIEGDGTAVLRVAGVGRNGLSPCAHAVVADRVQAATYMSAVAICGGEVDVHGAIPGHMEMLLTRFAEMGLEIVPRPDGVRVAFSGRLRSIDVATLPYPGVATDYKPLLVAMLAVAGGTGIVTENLYPGRFRYVEELRKLGADIAVDGHHAVVTGRDHLTGAEVRAPDIRAGAALVVAGLGAIGMTEISDIGHIERGYDDLVGRLASIGGAVTVID